MPYTKKSLVRKRRPRQPSDTSSLADGEIPLDADQGGAYVEKRPETLEDVMDELLIGEIIHRKRTTAQEREDAYDRLALILLDDRDVSDLYGEELNLVAALMPSIRDGSNEKETAYALEVLALIVAHAPTPEVCKAVYGKLRRTIFDSTFPWVKIFAIRTFGFAVFCSDASSEEVLEHMAYLLKIISSDGFFIDAGDDPIVVIAALEAWGLLASRNLDLSEASQEAVEVFADQLESTHHWVQLAAGENIALLYERSYSPRKPSGDRFATVALADDKLSASAKPNWVQRYEPYRRTDQVVELLTSLVRANRRSAHRYDRQLYRTTFDDILKTVENPLIGPRYATTLYPKEYAGTSRAKRLLREVSNQRINNWWQLHRLQALLSVLEGNFGDHHDRNKLVYAILPIAQIHEKTFKLELTGDKPNDLKPKMNHKYLSPEEAREWGLE